jgi:Fe-S-cluster-containing hydrogenase component 2
MKRKLHIYLKEPLIHLFSKQGLGIRRQELASLHLTSDSRKCTGCRICELTCSEIKKKLYNPKRALIRVVRIPPGFNVAVACLLCDKHPCVTSCPKNALEADNSGRIIVNEERCSGCGWCIQACEFGAILPDLEKGVVAVCDLCGGDPECIKTCPEEALELTTEDIVAQRARRHVAEELIERVSERV